MLDDIDLDIPEEEPQRPRPSGNRSFLVVAGILGAIMLLALIGLAIYALVILPRQQAAEEAGPSSLQLTSTALAQALQVTNTPSLTPSQTATNTLSPTPIPTDTPLPSDTPAVSDTPLTPIFTSAASATDTLAPSATVDPAGQTATAQSVLTAAAAAATSAALGTPSATPSALPDSGFADDVGLPGLAIATALLLAIIFATRALRPRFE
jgi:cytoskeletal protein RodZ